MVEADHDMRNSTDMIVLTESPRRCSGFGVSGWCRASPGRSAHRSRTVRSPPGQHVLGTDHPEPAVPVGTGHRHRQMSDDLGTMITSMTQMQNLMNQFSEAMNSTVGSAGGMAAAGQRSVEDMNTMKATLDQMRDNLADFDDAVRPLRNYFYREPHCFNIPVCQGIRSAFDATDGVDRFSDDMSSLQRDMTAMIGGMDEMVNGMGDMNVLGPQMVAQFLRSSRRRPRCNTPSRPSTAASAG